MSCIQETCSQQDDPQEEQKEPLKGHFRFSIFFDGTGNNRYNVAGRKLSEGDEKEVENLENLEESVEARKAQLKKEFLIKIGPLRMFQKTAKFVPGERELEKLKKAKKRYPKLSKRDKALMSYGNENTNVDLLAGALEKKKEHHESVEDFYLHKIIYMEGIGTAAGTKDDKLGSAFGRQYRGVQNTAYRAIQEVLKDIVSIMPQGSEDQDVEILEIAFDVFGFSRGSAAARNFEYQILNNLISHPPILTFKESLKANLERSGKSVLPIPEPIFKYVGLFDTVLSVFTSESIMTVLKQGHKQFTSNNHLSEEHKAAEENHHAAAVKFIGVPSSSKGKHKIHIVAENEYRMNFPLTSFQNADDLIRLHGAHSDIGGGYEEDKEHNVIRKFSFRREFQMYDSGAISSRLGVEPDKWHENPWTVRKAKQYLDRINEEVKWLKENGWVEDENSETLTVDIFDKSKAGMRQPYCKTKISQKPELLIVTNIKTSETPMTENGQKYGMKRSEVYTVVIELERENVSNKYSLIPLLVMLKHIEDSSKIEGEERLKFSTLLTKTENTIDEYPLLKKYMDKIGPKGLNYCTDTELIRQLTHKYFHMSAIVSRGMSESKWETVVDGLESYPRFIEEPEGSGFSVRQRAVFDV